MKRNMPLRYFSRPIHSGRIAGIQDITITFVGRRPVVKLTGVIIRLESYYGNTLQSPLEDMKLLLPPMRTSVRRECFTINVAS